MPLPDPGTWPAGVEWRPRRQSFSESPHAAVRAIRMEAGNTAREALDADEVVRIQVLWRFTPAEWSETMRPFFVAHRATGWEGDWRRRGRGDPHRPDRGRWRGAPRQHSRPLRRGDRDPRDHSGRGSLMSDPTFDEAWAEAAASNRRNAGRLVTLEFSRPVVAARGSSSFRCAPSPPGAPTPSASRTMLR